MRRKAAGTLRVRAHGRSAHSGSAPDSGANALLALADAAQAVGARHDPLGPGHLTAVPTVVRCGEAFNVVPAAGELLCDLRADELETFDDVLAGLPKAVDGVRLEGELMRRWPGMDARAATAPLLARPARGSGRPIVGAARGGASDASYMAPGIAITIDGLGPCGGRAHTPAEYIVEASLTDACRGRAGDRRRGARRMTAASGKRAAIMNTRACIRPERALGFRRSVISRIRADLGGERGNHWGAGVCAPGANRRFITA